MKNNSRGFTLIELSIVVVVIGLIVGSIMVGQSIVRGAQLQSVAGDVDNYKKAAQLFKDKYKALPGDMPNANTFWGISNGNGDGYIGTPTTGTPTSIGATFAEQMYAWQQLGEAELVSAQYTGAVSATTSELEPGVNIPASQYNRNGYSMFYAKPSYNVANFFNANYNHIIVFGKISGGGAGATPSYFPGITALDAFQIDTKIDDGKPGTGRVLSYTSALQSSCASTAVSNTAVYQTTTETPDACALIFLTGF